MVVANRGAADVTVKQVKFDGFDGGATLHADGASSRRRAVAAAAVAARRRRPPISTLKKDQVGPLRADADDPGDARVTEPYWHRDGEAGRYTFDADAPFGLPYRPTPFYVQVTLDVRAAATR